MFDESTWFPATGEGLQDFFKKEGLLDGKLAWSPHTKVHTRDLPFYKGGSLGRLMDSQWTPESLRVYFLIVGDLVYRLDGTSAPIHAANAKAIHLNETNVLDYLRFFCYFSRDEQRPFLFLEDMSSPYLPLGLSDQTRQAIEETVRPPELRQKRREGFFRRKTIYECDGIVLHKSTVFIAIFSVHSDGMVDMTDDESIMWDLPFTCECPIVAQ